MAGEQPNPLPSSPDDLPRPAFDDRDTVFAETAAAGEGDFLPSLTNLLAPPEREGELGRLAHYRVLKLLGQGGMGAVFLAEDAELQRPVALKMILPQFVSNPTVRERFLREARAAALIKNDHVVAVYQVGADRGVPFLAMELLQGENLEARLNRREPLPWPEVLRIGREVAAGLAGAHDQGLIHRDIKPANIWLEGAPGASHPPGLSRRFSTTAGRVKLLDFGLARAAGASSNLTQTRRIGTPEFMSPEQARGEELDARSDLFSLGAVLYILCTRQPPFPGDNVMAILMALALKEPRPIRELAPDVPPALADLVTRLLDKEPDNRPASAREVKEALDAIEPSKPVEDPLPPRTASAEPLALPSPALVSPGQSTRNRLIGFVALFAGVLIGALGLMASWLRLRPTSPTGPPIRVGVLHSRTGTMAISERPIIDAVLLAVDEINAGGGLLGRPVEAVLADGESDETVFARQAEKLIRQDNVCTIFGCWTSASRKAVVPVIERCDSLLFYPVQYEGLEQSSHVVYLGPVPNQQILPALRWLVGFEGKRRWFLVGSDYVFPAAANAIIRDEAKARGCEVVGERYVRLGSSDVAAVVREIVEAKPDLIVNTINGDTNVAFFRALRQAGVSPKKLPTLSLSISEEELNSLGPQHSAGDYVAGNYLQSINSPANQEFLRRFGGRYGPERVVSSAMETAYAGVHLWARAVQTAGRDDARTIRAAVKGQTWEAPQGLVRIDPTTRHAVQIARVGQIDGAGLLREVYCSPQPVAPEPFPASRSRQAWVNFLEELHRRWGGRWSNPGP